MAIASYERTLVSNQSPFDQLIAGNNALTPQENQGFQLFGQVGCAGCHAGALMSDNQFHYIGESPAAEDSGRITVSHNPVDLGAMRTPSLRNVGLRSVFMHDGRFSTLAAGGRVLQPRRRLQRPQPATRASGRSTWRRRSRRRWSRSCSARSPIRASPTRPRRSTGRRCSPRAARCRAVLDGGARAAAGAPQLVAFEPPLVGNPRFTVGVYGALGGANAVLVLDAARAACVRRHPGGGVVRAALDRARRIRERRRARLGDARDPRRPTRSRGGRSTGAGTSRILQRAAASPSSAAFQLTLFGLNGSGAGRGERSGDAAHAASLSPAAQPVPGEHDAPLRPAPGLARAARDLRRERTHGAPPVRSRRWRRPAPTR